MTDISKTIEPKSDQLNSDDLLTGPRTVEIESVNVVSGDQPVHINYKGGEGKPFKPCKSMRRILIMAWGSDGEKYIGQKMTLWCDPSVKWAGYPVGGIRISHMTGLPNDKTMRVMLTETRGKRGAYSVDPLVVSPKQTLSDAEFERFGALINDATTMAELSVIAGKIKDANFDADGGATLRAEYQKAVDVIRASEVVL